MFMSKKIIKVTGLITLLFIALGLMLFSTIIFQEGNPLPISYGIVKLYITKDTFAKIDENKYIFRANNGDLEKLTDYLTKNDLIFVDREGSGLLFKDKAGQIHTASIRMYTNQFEILDFGKRVKN